MIGRMAHPAFHFYVHVDKKTDIRPYLYLASLPNVYLIRNRVKVVWGGYATVVATLESVREILQSGRSYDYIHLMSGQDYPIRPAAEIYDFFCLNAGREFVQYEHFDDWAGESYPRIREYHLTNYRFPGRYYIQRLMNSILPVRVPPGKMEFYGSSMFWALSAGCLQSVLKRIDGNARFRRFLQLTWGADEFFFQTMVMNSAYRDRVINDNLLFLDREKGAPHPNLMTLSHLAAIKKSEKLFARKFENTAENAVLDEIDRWTERKTGKTGPASIGKF